MESARLYIACRVHVRVACWREFWFLIIIWEAFLNSLPLRNVVGSSFGIVNESLTGMCAFRRKAALEASVYLICPDLWTFHEENWLLQNMPNIILLSQCCWLQLPWESRMCGDKRERLNGVNAAASLLHFDFIWVPQYRALPILLLAKPHQPRTYILVAWPSAKSPFHCYNPKAPQLERTRD